MNRFALPEGSNWVVVIATFAASISLAGFTCKWLSKRSPALERFGFLLYLSVTTGYFALITAIMQRVH
jgi:hypothetical protein